MRRTSLPEMKSLSFIAGFGIVWNLIGIAVFIIALMTSRQALESAGTPAYQIDYIFDTPLWALIANGLAVLTGFMGSVALLLRKQISYYMFIVSLLAIMAVMIDTVLRGGFAYLGPMNNAVSLAVVLIGLLLFWAAHQSNIRGSLS